MIGAYANPRDVEPLPYPILGWAATRFPACPYDQLNRARLSGIPSKPGPINSQPWHSRSISATKTHQSGERPSVANGLCASHVGDVRRRLQTNTVLPESGQNAVLR